MRKERIEIKLMLFIKQDVIPFADKDRLRWGGPGEDGGNRQPQSTVFGLHVGPLLRAREVPYSQR